MKTLLTLILLILSSSLFSQTNTDSAIFSNAHGLKWGTALYFEVEGYNIFADFARLPMIETITYNDAGLKRMKKKYNISKEDEGTVDSSLKVIHRIFVTEDNVSDNFIQKNVIYFIASDSNRMKAITFSTLFDRRQDVEKLFAKNIIEESVPAYVYSEPTTDSINFAGRKIYLGGACRWMGPHNVQCPDYGQISWSEFRTIEDAKNYADLNFRVTAAKGIGKILESDSVNVIFEGVDTKAFKTKFKFKIPTLVMGGSNILIIYYLAENIRGKNIACVMSHYTDDVNAKVLAPLLGEVMKLKE